MALEELAMHAHEAHNNAKKAQRVGGSPVEEEKQSLLSTIGESIKSGAKYIPLGIAFGLIAGFMGGVLVPAMQGEAAFNAATIAKEVFGFGANGFSFANFSSYVLSFPLVGTAIAAASPFLKNAFKSLTPSNHSQDHAKGKSGHGQERGVTEGIIAATPTLADQAPTAAWHPANDRAAGHSFVDQVGGQRSAAQSLAERIEAERANHSSRQELGA